MRALLTILLFIVCTTAFAQGPIPAIVVPNRNTTFKQSLPANSLVLQSDSLKYYILTASATTTTTIATASKVRFTPLAQRGGFLILNEPNALGINLAGTQYVNGTKYYINGVGIAGSDTAAASYYVDVTGTKKSGMAILRNRALFFYNENLSGGGDFSRLRFDDGRAILQYRAATINNSIVISNDSTSFYMRGTWAGYIDAIQRWHIPAIVFNDGSIQTSAAVFPDTLSWLNPVNSITSFVPCIPADSGKRYIAATASGGWSQNKIYECDGSTYSETSPTLGDAVTVIDSSKVFIFNGSAWVASSSVSAYWAASGTSVFNTNSGFVGIGTTTPGYKLDVNGILRARTAEYVGSSATNQLLIGPAQFTKYGSGDFVFKMGNSPADVTNFVVQTNNGAGLIERFRVSSAGDVSISNGTLYKGNVPFVKSNVDGNFNVTLGDSAGYSLTNGVNNVFCGVGSGKFNTSGNNNNFMCYQSGYHNTSGSDNLFFGYQSGYSNTTAGPNTFFGYQSGYHNTSGVRNTFMSYQTGFSNTSGSDNVFFGYHSGYSNTIGNLNLFLGHSAGYSNVDGNDNTMIGYHAGYLNSNGSNNLYLGAYSGGSGTTASRCVYLGFYAGYQANASYNVAVGFYAAQTANTGNNVAVGYSAASNMTGQQNVILGYNAFSSGSTGNNLVIIGEQAGLINTGTDNTFVGQGTGYSNTSGAYNTYLGKWAGIFATGSGNTYVGKDAGYTGSGWNNTIMGYQAGYSLTTGANNLFLGSQAGYSNTGAGNIFIGTQAGYYNTGSDSLTIENSSNRTTPLIGGNFSTNDVTVSGDLHVMATDAFYFGGESTDGSWRIIRSGDNLLFERRESGVWVTKQTMTP